MSESQEIRVANAHAIDARHRMQLSFGAVKERIRPARLARDTATTMREKAEDAAYRGAEIAVRRPVLVAGAVAAAGLVLARSAIRGAVRRKRRHAR